MSTSVRPDDLSPHTVFRVYAWGAIAVGIFFYGWGDFPLQWLMGRPVATIADMPSVPFGRISAMRLAAAAAIAFGLWARSLTFRTDEFSRRDLMRFAIGHLIVGGLVFLQWFAIWNEVLPAVFGWTPLVAGFVLLMIAGDFDRWLGSIGRADAPAHTSGTIVTHDIAGLSLRGRYEEQIRQTARQEERSRLARDLHDAVKQQLFAIQTAAATAQARLESDTAGVRDAIGQVRASTREALTEMEVMLDQLQANPMTTTGLVDALRRACEAIQFRTDAQVAFEAGDLPADVQLAPGTHQALFRFAQEALANVARHARAAHVRVHFGPDQEWTQAGSHRRRFVLSVTDDGQGFEPSMIAAGMGLRNMAARAAEAGGTLEVRSEPGKGAMVAISISTEAPSIRIYVMYLVLAVGGMAYFFVLEGGLTLARPMDVFWAICSVTLGIRAAVGFYRVRSWR